MSWEEFYNLAISNLTSIIILCFVYGVFSYLLIKNEIFSIFDPLNVIILNFVTSLAIISFLIIIKKGNINSLKQLLFINIIFIISLKLFFLLIKEKKILTKKIVNIKIFKIYFHITSIAFYIFVFNYFYFIGVKTFENKILAFSNNGIFLYLREYLILSQLSLINIKKNIYKIKNSKTDYLSIILIFIIICITGGKASIVNLIIYFYTIAYFLKKPMKLNKIRYFKKFEKKLLLLSIFSLIFFFGIVYKENNISAILKKIFFRIISNGDAYYMAYPNNIINSVRVSTFFEYYIGSLFKPILERIFDYHLNLSLGFQLVEKIYGYIAYTGPNTKYDIISQVNIGYLGGIISIIYSFIIVLFSRIMSKNFIILQVVIILYSNIMQFYIDFSLFSLCLLPIIILLPLKILLVYFIYTILGKKG